EADPDARRRGLAVQLFGADVPVALLEEQARQGEALAGRPEAGCPQAGKGFCEGARMRHVRAEYKLARLISKPRDETIRRRFAGATPWRPALGFAGAARSAIVRPSRGRSAARARTDGRDVNEVFTDKKSSYSLAELIECGHGRL